MDLTTILIVAAALVAVGYVLFGKDRLATAIRSWIPFLKNRAADKVDSVQVRTEVGAEKAKAAHQAGRRTLYEVNQLIEAARLEIKKKMDEVSADNKALKLAADAGDRAAFDALVAELNNDQAEYAAMEKSLAALQEERDSLAGYVDQQAKAAREKERRARELVVTERVADITTMVGEAKAGLAGQDTGDADFAAAEKMVDKKMARANAAKNAGEGMTADERAQKQAAAYMAAANSGATAVRSDDLWAKMTGQNNAEPAPADPATPAS